MTLSCLISRFLGDRTRPTPVTQTTGSGPGRVRTEMSRAPGGPPGPAGGTGQQGTSATGIGQTETGRGP